MFVLAITQKTKSFVLCHTVHIISTILRSSEWYPCYYGLDFDMMSLIISKVYTVSRSDIIF